MSVEEAKRKAAFAAVDNHVKKGQVCSLLEVFRYAVFLKVIDFGMMFTLGHALYDVLDWLFFFTESFNNLSLYQFLFVSYCVSVEVFVLVSL